MANRGRVPRSRQETRLSAYYKIGRIGFPVFPDRREAPCCGRQKGLQVRERRRCSPNGLGVSGVRTVNRRRAMPPGDAVYPSASLFSPRPGKLCGGRGCASLRDCTAQFRPGSQRRTSSWACPCTECGPKILPAVPRGGDSPAGRLPQTCLSTGDGMVVIATVLFARRRRRRRDRAGRAQPMSRAA